MATLSKCSFKFRVLSYIVTHYKKIKVKMEQSQEFSDVLQFLKLYILLHGMAPFENSEGYRG